MAQKVVIPKGLINPQETTIVEIPKNLQNAGTVVARRPQRSDSTSSSSPRSPRLVKNRSYTRHTIPSRNKSFEGKAALDVSGKATTFYGKPFDPDATPPEHLDPNYKYNIPRLPEDRYMTTLSPGDLSYKNAKLRDMSYNESLGYGVFKRAPAFEKDIVHSSTMRNIEDSPERSLYRDFRPPGRSSPPLSPARTPESMRHWHSDIGTVSPTSPQSDPESYFHSEVTTETPDEIQTEITEEKSYYDYSSSGPDLSGLPEGGVDSSGEYCPPCSDSSGGYQRYDSSGSSGGYQNLQMSNVSPCSPSRKLTQRDLLDSLGSLESTEMSQIMTDLNQFQSARRKLVFDASSLASAADVSVNLLGSATI